MSVMRLEDTVFLINAEHAPTTNKSALLVTCHLCLRAPAPASTFLRAAALSLGLLAQE